MCVTKCKDYTRKCSEAGRLKALLKVKCSPSENKSDTRGLHAALPHFVSIRLKDFLPRCALNSISSRSTNENVLPSGTQTSPLDCCFLS